VSGEWSVVRASSANAQFTTDNSYVKELAARSLNFFKLAVFIFIMLLFHKTIFLLSQIGQTPISSQCLPLQFFISLKGKKHKAADSRGAVCYCCSWQ